MDTSHCSICKLPHVYQNMEMEQKLDVSEIIRNRFTLYYVNRIQSKSNNIFASASLEQSIKIWKLGSSTSNFTFEGHVDGYYNDGEKPYLICGADDCSVYIWNYQGRCYVQSLQRI